MCSVLARLKADACVMISRSLSMFIEMAFGSNSLVMLLLLLLRLLVSSRFVVLLLRSAPLGKRLSVLLLWLRLHNLLPWLMAMQT